MVSWIGLFGSAKRGGGSRRFWHFMGVDRGVVRAAGRSAAAEVSAARIAEQQWCSWRRGLDDPAHRQCADGGAFVPGHLVQRHNPSLHGWLGRLLHGDGVERLEARRGDAQWDAE